MMQLVTYQDLASDMDIDLLQMDTRQGEWDLKIIELFNF